MFCGCVVISDLYLFQEMVLLNSCFIFYVNLMLSFIEKVTTANKVLALFIWNVAPVVNVASLVGTGGLVSGLAATSGVLDISKITQFFDHGKPSSISQLIKGKSRVLQELLKYFNETTTIIGS